MEKVGARSKKIHTALPKTAHHELVQNFHKPKRMMVLNRIPPAAMEAARTSLWLPYSVR